MQNQISDRNLTAHLTVQKIGGGIQKTPEDRERALEKILKSEGTTVVVFSAPFGGTGGITDSLYALAEGNDTINSIKERFESFYQGTDVNLQGVFDNLAERVARTDLTKDFYSANIAAWGEYANSLLMHELLSKRLGLERVQLLSPEYLKLQGDKPNNATFDPAGDDNLRNKILSHQGITVAPGFIGTDSEGKTMTIGREGSDFTATYIAGVLARNHPTAVIWKDVSGVLRINPKLLQGHEKAYAEQDTVEFMSYRMAQELGLYGSRILHQETMSPLIRKPNEPKNLALQVRNIYNSSRFTEINGHKDESGVVVSVTGREINKEEYLGHNLESSQKYNIVALVGYQLNLESQLRSSLQSAGIPVLAMEKGDYSVRAIIPYDKNDKDNKILNDAIVSAYRNIVIHDSHQKQAA